MVARLVADTYLDGLQWLSATGVSAALRQWRGLLSVISVAHLVGATLIAGTSVAVIVLVRTGLLLMYRAPVAWKGAVAITVLTGLAVVLAQPVAFLTSPVFGAKMGVFVVAATTTARGLRRDRFAVSWGFVGFVTILWMATVVLGRLAG